MKILGYEINFISSENLIEGAKVYFKIGPVNITDTLISGFIISFLLIVIAHLLTRKMKILPSSRQLAGEAIYYVSENLAALGLGKNAKKFAPFIGTLFFYIFFSNIAGVFPTPVIIYSDKVIELRNFLRSPTSDLNSTVALALCAIIYVIYNAIYYQGLKGYLKGFTQPTLIMLPLNIIGELAKPFSLSARLFGNILSGMVILALAYNYPKFPIIFPVFLHFYFDLFAGLIQSIIFVGLTSVHLSFVVSDEE